MRATVIATALALLVAGCGSSERSGTFATEEGEGSYTVDTSTGATNIEVQTAEGTATIRSGADVPVNLPAGFTLYPGAKVVTSTNAGQGDQQVNSVMMQTADSLDEVIAFYRGQAERNGMTIEGEMNSGQTRGFNGHSEAVDQLGVIATRGEQGTTVQLTVASGLR